MKCHIIAEHHYSDTVPQTGRLIDGPILRPDGTPVVYIDQLCALAAVRAIESCKYICEPGETQRPTLTIVPAE